eukprot:5570756-Prymnesium_polylepis.1
MDPDAFCLARLRDRHQYLNLGRRVVHPDGCVVALCDLHTIALCFGSFRGRSLEALSGRAGATTLRAIVLAT